MKYLMQTSGALLWGIFWVIIPFELMLLAPVYLSIFVWREYLRTKKYGFIKGFVMRVGVIILIIFVATIYPNKWIDKKIEPLSSTTVTLATLYEEGIIMFYETPELAKYSIELETITPTRLELLNKINRINGVIAHVSYCGNGASILFGSSPISKVFVTKVATPTR